MDYVAKPLKFEPDTLQGISQKTIDIHYGKLYQGYVAKYNEVLQKLKIAAFSDQLEKANQSFSDWRSLQNSETFTLDAILLHEMYFANLGGNGSYKGLEIEKAIIEQYGSVDAFKNILVASGMSARGWVVVAFNSLDNKIHCYACDVHNQGAIWGAIPVLILDVYEHAYFIDYGSDRKSYIEAFWKNLDWSVINDRYISIDGLVE